MDAVIDIGGVAIGHDGIVAPFDDRGRIPRRAARRDMLDLETKRWVDPEQTLEPGAQATLGVPGAAERMVAGKDVLESLGHPAQR